MFSTCPALAVLFFLLALPLPSGEPWFRYHPIARELPGRAVGLGGLEVADLDADGRRDVVVLNRGDQHVYWFRNAPDGSWRMRPVGKAPVAQLGVTQHDIDGDGRQDVVYGGFWFHTPRDPLNEPFTLRVYDSRIRSEIHDIAMADLDGDGNRDVVALGDREGLFWYRIPKDPLEARDWHRFTISADVVDRELDIHGGFAPGGVGDLDGDGDADIVLADRWLENRQAGLEWTHRRIPFGRRGPWGSSSRSWVADVDGDGDNDIILADCDGQNSGAAWMENNGQRPPSFVPHYLAQIAPGTRGSFHALWYADLSGDGKSDIVVAEQEDPKILPQGASPRHYVFVRQPGGSVAFQEQVVLDERLGGHDLRVADMDGDGDADIVFKVWSSWRENANGGRPHVGWLENRTLISKP